MKRVIVLTAVEGFELGWWHVHRWANDALREEVPTLSNSMLSHVAGEQCVWFSSAVQGTRLPVGVLVTPASATGVFAGPRPKSHDRTQVAMPQITNSMYQEMARITANGGAQSGSHPAWDPV